jgi:zinc transporter 2
MVEDPLIMVITAGFGLFCNIVMAKVLHSTPGNAEDSHGGNLFH